MKEFYAVYRFVDDFILLAAFADKGEAEEYHAKQKANGTPNLYSRVVEQSVGSLIVTLSPWGRHEGAELLVNFIDKVAA